MRRNVKLRLLAMAGLALAASACAPQVIERPIFPSRADMEAVTEAKPVPPIEIVTDPEVEAQYDADLESWGERLRSAGIRLCNWSVEQGADYICPKDD